MSYSTDIAAQRLSDRRWRLLHSAWLLAPIFGLGIFSFVGFFYCAFRIRSAKWWRIAAVVGVLTTIAWVLVLTQVEEDGAMSDLAGFYVLFLWIGLIIWGLVLNRDYLRWRAGRTRQTAWYSQPVSGQAAAPLQAPPPPMPLQAPPAAPGLQGFTDVASDNYYAPRAAAETPPPPAETPAAAHRPDINHATAGELASALAIDPALAQKVVRARESNGGFQNIDDLATVAGLQPHEYVHFRDRVVVGPRPPTPPRSGRILDY